jgi:hypothetical protein
MVAEIKRPDTPEVERLEPNRRMAGKLRGRPIQIFGTAHGFYTRPDDFQATESDTTYSTGEELVLDDGTIFTAVSNAAKQPSEHNPLYDAAV